MDASGLHADEFYSSLLVSQVANLWGRKWPLVIALFVGGVGTIVASRAESMGTTIAGYCLIGVNFGAQPLIHAVVSEILPRKQRPAAQASVNMIAGLGAIIGICMGGALLRNNVLSNYRIFEYVNAAIFWVAALGVAVGYSPPPRELQTSLTHTERLRSLDWIGYVLLAPGLILFCVALSWSNNPYHWSSGRIIGTFVSGLILMIAFVIYEWKFQNHGMLHHKLFQRGRNFPLALVLIFTEGLTFFAANAYYAFEVSVFKSDDLLIAGLHFGVTFLVGNIFAFLAAMFSMRLRMVKLPIFAGFVFILIFNICMATSTPSTSDGALWGFGAILGVGIGKYTVE